MNTPIRSNNAPRRFIRAVAIARNDDDVIVASGPLALNAQQPGPEIEDQVIPLNGICVPYPDTELCSRRRNREFGGCSFLVRRQHLLSNIATVSAGPWPF